MQDSVITSIMLGGKDDLAQDRDMMNDRLKKVLQGVGGSSRSVITTTAPSQSIPIACRIHSAGGAARPSPPPPSSADVACVPVAIPPEAERLSQSSSPQLLADKYLLLNLVEGSSLYSCIDVHTQQELVCKIVPLSCCGGALMSAHFRLEGCAHVNPLHEVVRGERYLYLVFPRAHGDLHSHVRARRRLRESDARRLFRQIAATVRSCHRRGIVLRDLKLRKFVFADAQKSELKLESLDDAVVLDDPENDVLHDKRGCPAYVSPEILRAGARYSGKAADMWSLGVILYTMLVGRYPFNDSEHASLFAKISRGNFIMPECLSSRAKCLIRSLLRREPSERIASEDILLHPWFTREDKDCYSRGNDQLVPDLCLFDNDD